MKKYSDKEKEELLNRYFNIHGKSYKDYQIKHIREMFGEEYNDALTQLYYALNMLDENENPYIAFRELIEKTFGLDLNILEIGGGVYPALSDAIHTRQLQIGKGKITVYDPLLSKKLDMSGITLVRKQFNRDDDVSKYDLIIGKEPCAATTTAIRVSLNKNLVLSPCKCYSLLPSYMEFNDNPLKQWYEYVYSALENYGGQLSTHYLAEATHYDNPIYTKTAK